MWKTPFQEYLFQILPQKNAEVGNPKNPDLYLIRSILLECGYFGFIIRFWISPKKPQNLWIPRIRFQIFPKKRTLYHDICSVTSEVFGFALK